MTPVSVASFSNGIPKESAEEILSVSVRQLPHAANLPLPAYATDQSAGLDLLAAVPEPVIMQPLRRVLVPCGIALALPKGYEAQIRPRSGLALRYGLTVANAPGTIDSDYRGEVKALMINLSDSTCRIEPGQRIAQMIIARHCRVALTQVETLDGTARGEGGFGSTGVSGLATVKEHATV